MSSVSHMNHLKRYSRQRNIRTQHIYIHIYLCDTLHPYLIFVKLFEMHLFTFILIINPSHIYMVYHQYYSCVAMQYIDRTKILKLYGTSWTRKKKQVKFRSRTTPVYGSGKKEWIMISMKIMNITSRSTVSV